MALVRGNWRIRRKKLSVPHCDLLCLFLPVAPRLIPGTAFRYKQNARITRKDNYNDTEEICETRGSCRCICRDPSGGTSEQFPPRKSTRPSKRPLPQNSTKFRDSANSPESREANAR